MIGPLYPVWLSDGTASFSTAEFAGTAQLLSVRYKKSCLPIPAYNRVIMQKCTVFEQITGSDNDFFIFTRFNT
jgi:hypothetical protein